MIDKTFESLERAVADIHDGATVMIGGVGNAEWTGWVPFDDLPHVFDPPEHFIVTANNRASAAAAARSPESVSCSQTIVFASRCASSWACCGLRRNWNQRRRQR